MGTKRDSAIAHKYFDCEYCVRPQHAKKLPTHGADGVKLEDHERLEIYNDRRFKHYLDDFSSAEKLKEHLRDRVLHWMYGKSEIEIAEQLEGVQATVNWWIRAQGRKAHQRQLRGVGA